MFGYFLALRAITQKPLEYFLEHQEMLGIFMDLDEPMNVEQEVIYEDADYSNLMNLVTHINDASESLSLKNSVISIFFLRFLQHGKYFQNHIPDRRANDSKLHPKEKFVLKLINHLIAVQCFNHQQVTELAVIKKQYKWEVIGASLHPSLSLVNHSCEPNTFNFNINQTSILIANRHIHHGEEITMSYDGVDYRTMKREQREYKLLKNYMFQCECRACLEKWGLKEQIPDELARIPNFEQERCFVVRFGDKKDICDEINGARWMADYGIASNTFNVAQEALDHLSVCLTKHVVKPHLHFVEASEMAELFAINQYCRMPLEIVDEEDKEETEKKTEVYDCEMEVDQYIKKSVKKSDVQNALIDKPSEPDGTSKLIKSFETGSDTNVLPTLPREKSPTLRMFASLNDEDLNGKGPRKKSVLDRIEDKFNQKAKSNEQSKAVKDKAKRELADSMRRFSKKEEMAERMSAFQPKKLIPKSWTDKPKLSKEIQQESPVNENVVNIIEDESKSEKLNRNSVIYEFLDTIKDKVSGVKEIKTDDQINDEISKMIENRRKKIREERNARKNKENRHSNSKPQLEPQYENLETKNTECKREIVKREEKLTKMIESSNERDKLLKAREAEIQRLREKTKKMLEDAKKKDDEFEDAEKNFFKNSFKSVISDKSESKKNVKKGKSGQKSIKSTKQEIKSKAAASDDDKDLLAFLRQSHKKKANIYDFIDSSKSKVIDPPIVQVNGSDVHSDKNNNISSTLIDPIEPLNKVTFKDQTTSRQKLKGSNISVHKKKFIEDRWDDIKKKEAEEERNREIEELKKIEAERIKKKQVEEEEAELSSAESMAEEVVLKSSSINDDLDDEQVTANGKDWATQLAESIKNIEQISRPKDVEQEEKVVIQKSLSTETSMNDSISPILRKEKSLTPQPPSSDDTDMRHYSHRWSDRNTLSPSPCPEERKSTRRRKRGRYSMRNISVDSDSDDNAPLPVALPIPLPNRMTTVEKPPRSGRLSRRKSLSEDCLKTSKKSDVDAFGLPKISLHNKRSVSLIRDSFASPKGTKENPEKTEGKKLSITKETRTSNASEFKNKFEAGSVSNLSLINRSVTPFKPPKVDKCHLSKVKNKFNDTNEKLPFPNYKPIPPKPSCKPPPLPPL